jgi:alpha-tubulin suppressor-like RCC1 family protein
LSAGAYHTLAITNDGKHVFCWGRNDHGQLGNEKRTNSYTPIEITKNFTREIIKAEIV